jgi:hypothetical protein
MVTTEMETDKSEQTGESRIGTVSNKVRKSASEAYGTARERAQSAIATTRQGAAQAGKRAAEGVDAAPIAALVGGLAIGALVASLLPRTRREEELLGSLGGRINETARNAAKTARDAGREKLDEYGLSRDGLGERISELADSASAALRRSSK